MSSILSWIVWARSRKPSGLAPSSEPSAFPSLDSLLLVLRSTTQVEFERDIGQTLGRRFEDMGELGTGTCWNLLEPSLDSFWLFFFYPLSVMWPAGLDTNSDGFVETWQNWLLQSDCKARRHLSVLICSHGALSNMQWQKDIHEFVDWALSLRSSALILAFVDMVGMSKLVWSCLFGLDL